MIGRTVKVQLVIFSLLTITALLLIFFRYSHLPAALGINQIHVSAELPETGGLYPNANVTYRGYPIGKVEQISQTPGGVKIDMAIDRRLAPPQNSHVEVHSVSAIGEQFLDFVPDAAPSTPMHDGIVVPRGRAGTPIPTAKLLDDTDALLASIPLGDLNTVLDEGAAATRDVGPDLSKLIDRSLSLARKADANYQPTHDLIQQSPRFLDSQLASADAIHSWTSDLAKFTDELRRSDSSLERVLKDVPPAATEADDFLDEFNSAAPPLLMSADVLARLAKAYHAPIEQLLVVYPMVVAKDQLLVPKNQPGAMRMNFATMANQPACNIGWIPPGQPGGPREANELWDTTLPTDTYCRLPQTDPSLARSARFLQCFEPGSPPGRRAATIYQCAGSGYQTDQPRRLTVPTTPAPLSGVPLAPPNQPNDDKRDYSALAPDDPLAAVGATGTPGANPGERSWKQLMLTGTSGGRS